MTNMRHRKSLENRREKAAPLIKSFKNNYPRMKYSRIYFLRDTDTILD